MSNAFISAQSRRSDHYCAKREWSARLRRARAKVPESSVGGFDPAWNVVGVGIGEKLESGRATGAAAVRFLVRRKVSRRVIANTALMIPPEIDGIPTDVEQVGRIRLLEAGFATAEPAAALDVITPGCSIGFRGVNSRLNAGTLGALVEDASGATFLLSNCHVLADLAGVDQNFEITQPGTLDVSEPRGIGAFRRGEPPIAGQNNRIDAAIASLNEGVKVTNDVLTIGKPEGSARARVDMIVEKFGRSTLHQVGRVVSITYDLFVETPRGNAFFVDQIAVRGLHGQLFASDGDSGSLVLERTSNKAVGLLFAHSNGVAFANHLPLVLQRLGVRLKT